MNPFPASEPMLTFSRVSLNFCDSAERVEKVKSSSPNLMPTQLDLCWACLLTHLASTFVKKATEIWEIPFLLNYLVPVTRDQGVFVHKLHL